MNIDTAQHIAKSWHSNPPQKIEAIKTLRMNTSGMGLVESKNYLDSLGNEENMFAQLCKTFVESKHDRLIVLRGKLNGIQSEIELLEWEINEEESHSAWTEYLDDVDRTIDRFVDAIKNPLSTEIDHVANTERVSDVFTLKSALGLTVATMPDVSDTDILLGQEIDRVANDGRMTEAERYDD